LPFVLAQRGTQSGSYFYIKGGARWTRAVKGNLVIRLPRPFAHDVVGGKWDIRMSDGVNLTAHPFHRR
jgi:hypothetical protein